MPFYHPVRTFVTPLCCGVAAVCLLMTSCGVPLPKIPPQDGPKEYSWEIPRQSLVYCWSDGPAGSQERTWKTYEIVSEEGQQAVDAWIAAHREKLDQGTVATMNQGFRSSCSLYDVRKDPTHYWRLTAKLPKDASVPSSKREYYENFSRDELAEIRVLFETHGKPIVWNPSEVILESPKAASPVAN